MAAKPTLPVCDVAILDRLIRPERGDLSAAAARNFLKIDFEPGDHERMQELALKAQDGVLTAAEQNELTEYERVGSLIDLLHSKARRSLKRAKLVVSGGRQPPDSSPVPTRNPQSGG